MKKLLLTGATGFVGRNILPFLQEVYTVSAPSRAALNLLDADEVRRYLKKEQFDAVIHLANPTGHNPVDTQDDFCERSLKVFSTLERCFDLYGKMIYIGSGAEYGKHRDIALITENEFDKEVPKDSYGFSRYVMSKLAERHDNIVNLRLFACCGPGDPPHKLIPSIIQCIKNGNNIELNQNVWFDFLYIDDMFPVIKHFIENQAAYKAYNLCSGKRVLISAIAEEVKNQMNSNANIVFKKEGYNLEYTASNARLCAELTDWNPRSISEGIRGILLADNL